MATTCKKQIIDNSILQDLKNRTTLKKTTRLQPATLFRSIHGCTFLMGAELDVNRLVRYDWIRDIVLDEDEQNVFLRAIQVKLKAWILAKDHDEVK